MEKFLLSAFALTSLLTPLFMIAAGPVSIDRENYVKNTQFENEIGYARAVRVGRTLYLSGQTSKGEGMDQQVEKIYESLGKTLAHFGVGFGNVVKETIYTKDIEALKTANPVRKRFYGEVFPAATWVQVSRLFSLESLLEVELIAVLPESTGEIK